MRRRALPAGPRAHRSRPPHASSLAPKTVKTATKPAKKPARKAAKKSWMSPPPPRGAKTRALLTVERLRDLYPAVTELAHQDAFQLLIATILSAQTTDKSVNLVTPQLFKRYPTPADLAAADPAAVEQLIKPTGFFRLKTRRIIDTSRSLIELFGGVVPATLDELVKLPGIGRKTANVILGVGFGVPGLAVDTHVTPLTNRLRLVSRVTWVSTANPGTPNPTPRITFAVLRPMPGSLTNSSSVAGTTPPNSSIRLRLVSMIRRVFSRKKPVGLISCSTAAGSAAARSAGVG